LSLRSADTQRRRAPVGHHAGVDLADLPLRRRGILVLDDALHVAGGIAQDAAVAAGIGQLDRQQRQSFAAARARQRGGGVGADQRHVAIEDQCGRRGIVQRRQGLLDGVAGAELRLLAREHQPQAGHRGLDQPSLMPGDDHGAGCAQRSAGTQNMLQ
jgi:hypothetical protein